MCMTGHRQCHSSSFIAIPSAKWVIFAKNNKNIPPMNDLPFIPVIYMHRMIEMLREEHIDTDHVLRECGINPALMQRPDTMLTGRQAHVLITKFMGLSSNVYPGVHFGKRMDLLTHGLLGFVFFWEGSFRDMLDNIMAFMRVRFPLLNMELHHSPDYYSFRLSCDKRVGDLEPFFIQTMMGSIISLGSLMTQRMTVLCNRQAFSDLKALQNLLGSEVHHTDGDNEIRYYTSDISFKAARETPASVRESDGMEEHGFVIKLRNFLLENLKTNIGAEEIASRMGMSVRTMRRRLADQGLNFNSIRTDVRMQIAMRYLTTTSISIERIADHVGYSDQTTFTRAFREWKGQTPNEIRQQRISRKSTTAD